MAGEMMCSFTEIASHNPHSRIVVQQPQHKESGITIQLITLSTMAGSHSSPRTKSLPTVEVMLMPVADPNRPHVPPSNMPSIVSFPSSKTPPSPSSPQHLFPLKHSPSALLTLKSLEMAQLPPPSPPVAFLNQLLLFLLHFLLHHLLHQIHLPRLPSSNRPRAPSQSLPSPSLTTPQIKSPPSSSTSPITPLPSTSTQPPSLEQPPIQSPHPSSSSLLAPSPSTTQQSPNSPSTAKASSTSPPSQLPSPSTPPTSPTSPPLPPPPAVSSPLPPPLPSPSPSPTAPSPTSTQLHKTNRLPQMAGASHSPHLPLPTRFR
ncbi:uncharacterized protein MONOS_9408 [Monocercomonoides exilis]|uniref:uncharacterized protein n=1 Tax=Monocercomonoides exilis TaxID=2049356 RepID=UPI0035597413|nr:hypothetical protein MONOS_9408 [Monocercomonoides exilis]|eukprot:MONOS_9408.1-p1 / transcript=MONOS_9408.1 / gene=MONOS_9408 / organism=Monocercomonoides_exilis_PA203 / gene_product=unspecified product / transcript_product=unspecified product / location=Mono_scaffold00388:2791-3741(+) / protein_length=317 / sequence_SO=supercontig / SO=protein_coding / is_pseudo=false